MDAPAAKEDDKKSEKPQASEDWWTGSDYKGRQYTTLDAGDDVSEADEFRNKCSEHAGTSTCRVYSMRSSINSVYPMQYDGRTWYSLLSRPAHIFVCVQLIYLMIGVASAFAYF